MPRPAESSWNEKAQPHVKDRKKCSCCQVVKPPSEFPVNAARYDGLANYCVPCTNDKAYEIRRKARMAILESLGGKCVRCGFADWRALQVDHVNGDGAADRQKSRSPSHLAKLVRANPDRFQILCANCNSIKKIEQGEHRDRSTYTRAILTERVVRPRKRPAKAASYDRARTEAAEARQRELVALVNERRPLRKSPHPLPPGLSWSRWYTECLGCELTERKHVSDGLCWRCNKLATGANRRVSVYAEAPA
jgi:hypothetical protein